MECTSSGVVPVVKPSVGRRGGVGWGLVATGFLQSSHAATRINPKYRLGTMSYQMFEFLRYKFSESFTNIIRFLSAYKFSNTFYVVKINFTVSVQGNL